MGTVCLCTSHYHEQQDPYVDRVRHEGAEGTLLPDGVGYVLPDPPDMAGRCLPHHMDGGHGSLDGAGASSAPTGIPHAGCGRWVGRPVSVCEGEVMEKVTGLTYGTHEVRTIQPIPMLDPEAFQRAMQLIDERIARAFWLPPHLIGSLYHYQSPPFEVQ